VLLYSITVFLSAFLLFEVQPVIAKAILPWFGGTSAVWSTCMLFFQSGLLLGYLYAHWLHKAFAPRRQAMVHSVLLALSLAALPIVPNPYWKTGGSALPSLRILSLLTVTVGLPYCLLSSTSPLLQAWYARNHKQGLPYRLFALSNFASMLALLSYPLLVEPNLSNRLQAWIWSGAYAGFAILCAATSWRSALHPAASYFHPDEPAAADDAQLSWPMRLLWLGLAAAASVLLLSVTNHLTQDVAAIPFLWIAPLTVYLLSFILAFEAPRFYRRPLFLPLLALSLAFMAFELWPGRGDLETPWLIELGHLKIQWLIAAMTGALFVCCMVCHGELAQLKPHPRRLTTFFVTVALGGAAGGLFVGLVAPNFFHAFYEFPIGLGLCLAMVMLVMWRGLPARRAALRWAYTAALLVPLAGYVLCLGAIMRSKVTGYRVSARNFYGLLRVYDTGDPRDDEDAARKLVHGVINHGEQMLREEYRRMPVTYFCPESGIGRAMRATEGRSRRIGILGLGCGTLAAYGRAGDTLRIYEINPLVLDIARSQFTYLNDTPAKVEVAQGDGRLVLESEPDQQFDVLVMDAFSGDSVPVHLITREAFQTYFRHLKPGGILAVNITNLYLNLEPVMERAGNAFGKIALVYHYEPPEDDPTCFTCRWTLMMSPSAMNAHPELRAHAKELRPERPFRMWTDDFSNIFSILK
jgi:SAM-dependent methyltransferase